MSVYYAFGHHIAARPAMAPSTSSMSDVSAHSGPYSRRGQVMGYKPAMEIHLDNHFAAKIYTSSAPISGHVTITTSRDVRFDTLQIVLLGIARTRVEGLSTPHATSHTFLKLNMPISESSYPVPRLYESGRTYTVPFNFVIPSHLTINACSHTTDMVADHHTCLPPSMGIGTWERDDFAPEMAKVEYSIKARVFRDAEAGIERVKVMETVQPLRVLPAYPEEPPLSLAKSDREYRSSKSKTIRKSLLASKMGRLTVTAAQPGAIMLSADGHEASAAKTSVDITFEPVSADVAPPKITGISSKITAVTYYSSGGISQYPNLGDWSRHIVGDTRGAYHTTTTLSSEPNSKFAWSQQLSASARRDSGYSSDVEHGSDSDGAAAGASGRRLSSSILKTKKSKRTSPIYHLAQLRLPIKLPLNKKMFIPTFHSCITSRVYVLHVTVAFGAGASSTTIAVSLPLQVGVEALDVLQDEEGLPSFDAALEEAEADQFLRPRLLSIPDVQYQQGSQLPGYGDLVPSRTAVAT